MAARVINLSELGSNRRYAEFAKHMRRSCGERAGVRFSHEPIDQSLFGPLAEHIARETLSMEGAEKAFRCATYGAFESIRGRGLESHYTNYLGFLFETAVQLAILGFARDNPATFSVVRNCSGMLHDGCVYSVNERGSALFTRSPDLLTVAEIDAIGEFRKGPAALPVIFEITLMKYRRKFHSRKKKSLVGEIYGAEPAFCTIRQENEDEAPGAYLRFHPRRGIWRDLVIPKNGALQPLANKLMREEHADRMAGHRRLVPSEAV